jgi:VanZ family protein
MMAAVVALSLLPHLPHVAQFRGGDKLGHFAAYVALTFWFGQIYTSSRVRLTIAIGFVMLGISMEYLQRCGGYRTFEIADMQANAAGVLTALILTETRLSKGLATVEKSLIRFIS